MGHAILIETPFASAIQTAKILGVSKVRQKQLAKMLNRERNNVLVSSKSARKSGAVSSNRRLLNKKHASKKTRSSNGRRSSH